MHLAAGLLSNKDIQTACDLLDGTGPNGGWGALHAHASMAWDIIIKPVLRAVMPELAHVYFCVSAPCVQVARLMSV